MDIPSLGVMEQAGQPARLLLGATLVPSEKADLNVSKDVLGCAESQRVAHVGVLYRNGGVSHR